MDEDYDACDLENWYLAIQSADGQVVIPSFHRPGILMAADWLPNASQLQRSKILRPRQAEPALAAAVGGGDVHALQLQGSFRRSLVRMDAKKHVPEDQRRLKERLEAGA